MAAGKLDLVPVHDPALDAEPPSDDEAEPLTEEQILEQYWQLWSEQMRADAPEGTADDYLRNKVLKCYLFENERFTQHLRVVKKLVQEAPKAPPSVHDADVKLLNPEQFDAHMKAHLSPEKYAEWRQSMDAVPEERAFEPELLEVVAPVTGMTDAEKAAA